MENKKDEELFGAQYKINEAKREREWQKFKKNFLNKDSLIIFIAISIAVWQVPISFDTFSMLQLILPAV